MIAVGRVKGVGGGCQGARGSSGGRRGGITTGVLGSEKIGKVVLQFFIVVARDVMGTVVVVLLLSELLHAGFGGGIGGSINWRRRDLAAAAGACTCAFHEEGMTPRKTFCWLGHGTLACGQGTSVVCFVLSGRRQITSADDAAWARKRRQAKTRSRGRHKRLAP